MIFNVGWALLCGPTLCGLSPLIIYLKKTEVGSIMMPIVQRREKRLRLQTSLRSHSELEVVPLFVMLTVHKGLTQILAGRILMTVPFSFPPGVVEGPPVCERVSPRSPARPPRCCLPL